MGGRDAGHELAVHLEAGALDAARRCDRQGERGHRLACAPGLDRQASPLQRSRLLPSDAAPDPPARTAHAGGVARRGGHPKPGLEGYRPHPRGLDRRSAHRRGQPGRLDAPLPHRGAPGFRNDDRSARGSQMSVEPPDSPPGAIEPARLDDTPIPDQLWDALVAWMRGTFAVVGTALAVSATLGYPRRAPGELDGSQLAFLVAQAAACSA